MRKPCNLFRQAECRLLCSVLFAGFLAVISAIPLTAQQDSASQYYARRNSFGVLGAFSPDSSHILLGVAENRKLVIIGASYSRRLILNHIVNWQYDAELLPVVLESDPVQRQTMTIEFFPNQPPSTFTTDTPTMLACHPSSGSGTIGNVPYSYTNTCTRRWVIGEATSPLGFQWNFLPARTMQPIVDGHGGYMYSSQPIPIEGAGSFNFTFDIGAGFELYRTRTRSIRVEYRFHHISNRETASNNPGIDNGIFQVSYTFGR